MTFQLRVRLTHFQFFIRRSIWHSRPFPNETEANLPSNNTQTHQEWLLLYLYPSSRHFPARASIACWVMEVGLLGSNLGTPLAIGFLGTKSKGGEKKQNIQAFFLATRLKKNTNLCKIRVTISSTWVAICFCYQNIWTYTAHHFCSYLCTAKVEDTPLGVVHRAHRADRQGQMWQVSEFHASSRFIEHIS